MVAQADGDARPDQAAKHRAINRADGPRLFRHTRGTRMKPVLGKALALLAGVSMIACSTSTARAAHKGVELVKIGGVSTQAGKFIRKFTARANQPTTYYFSYYFSAYVPLKTKTVVAAWALVDWSACTEITAGKMKMTSPKKTKYGAWSIGTYTNPAGSYTICPDLAVKYDGAFFTWTKKRAPAGTTVSGTSDWVGVYSDAVTYNVISNMKVIYQGS